MRRSQKAPHGPYYVRAVPYAGDLPYLEVSLGSTMIFLNSNSDRQFEIVTDFDPDISRQQQEDDGISRNPAWSFLITNGQDTIYLHPNARKTFVTIATAESTMQTLHELQVKDAELLSANMFEACKQGSLSEITDCKLRPAGMFYTYHAKSRYLSFCNPADSP